MTTRIDLLPANRREWLRGSLGALLGIGLTAFLCRWLLGSDPAAVWLIAPMGASTVLLFAVPASPFAQPWPVMGGHLVAAALGLGLAPLALDPVLAIALTVGLAVLCMGLLRCLHPPAGGTAVVMALGSPAIAAAGWSFLLTPIALNVASLLVAALGYHRATGHSYPHHAPPPRPAPLADYDPATLDAVLEEWDEVLDIDREDLDAVIREVLRRSRG